MIKQITDQAKQGITDATTTAEVEKAKAQDLRHLITFKLTQQKTKSYRRIRNCTRPD